MERSDSIGVFGEAGEQERFSKVHVWLSMGVFAIMFSELVRWDHQ